MEGTRRPGVSVHARSAAGRPAGVQTGAVEGALWEREDTLMLAEGDAKPRNAVVVRAPSSAYLQITCPRPGAPAQGQVGATPTRRVSWSFRREEHRVCPGGAPAWLRGTQLACSRPDEAAAATASGTAVGQHGPSEAVSPGDQCPILHPDPACPPTSASLGWGGQGHLAS